MTPELYKWYNQNKRDLPWRNTRNPYKIWLSEVILQQTRVNQGLPYYTRFTTEFPDVKSLASAPPDKVMKLWQGLGYYTRARNMHKTAIFLQTEFNGQFPDTYNELLKLKGIGPYTAAAIASFAFDEARAVLDGNVFRVLSRFFGIKTPINSPKGKNQFASLAQQVMNTKQPALHNQAIMELGALICTPKNPDCNGCPVGSPCYAFQHSKQNKFPVKLAKTKVQTRYFNYLIIVNNKKHIWLHQRQKKDIWLHLYEFPMIESRSHLSKNELKKQLKKLNWFEKVEPLLLWETKHKLSHQTLEACFWVIHDKISPEFPSDFFKISLRNLQEYPVPKLLDNFINNTTLPHTFSNF